MRDKNQVLITFPDSSEHERMKRKRKGGTVQRQEWGLGTVEKDGQQELGEESWVGNKARNRGAEEK